MASRPSGESAPSGAEREDPESKVTRGNFEALAKRLFKVTPAELAAEEERQKADKASPKAGGGSA